MKASVYLLSAGLEFFFAVVSVILLIGCLFDHERGRKANRIFIAILIVHALMNVVDALLWLWCDAPELLALVKVLSFLSYALGICIFVLFTSLLVCYLREYVPVPSWVTGMAAAVSAPAPPIAAVISPSTPPMLSVKPTPTPSAMLPPISANTVDGE